MLCHMCWILWYSRTLKLFNYIEKSKNSTYFKAFHYFWSLIVEGGKGISEIQDIMCNRKTSLLLSSSTVLLKTKCSSLQFLQPKHCRTGPAWENHHVKLAVAQGMWASLPSGAASWSSPQKMSQLGLCHSLLLPWRVCEREGLCVLVSNSLCLPIINCRRCKN